jgi:hypothetical protein
MLIHRVRRGETAGETIEVVVASRYGEFSRGFQAAGNGCVRLGRRDRLSRKSGDDRESG